MKNKKSNWIVGIAVILLVIMIVWIVETKNNAIEDLQKQLDTIEKPFYYFDNSSGTEHNYFNYAGVEFSSYMSEGAFYGCELEDNDQSMMRLAVYCNVNKNVCKVEMIDLECIDKYDLTNMTFPLNSTGCTRFYDIEGQTEGRIY